MTLLPPPRIPWQITGNHWIALPCIHPIDASVHALGVLGLDGERARRAAQIFREHDEASVREMAQVQNGDDAAYVSLARLHIENLERALASDREMFNGVA